MNLTSHEYVVCQNGKYSPLIMSEFAGTYGSFGSALRVNPWDKQEVAEAIFEALEMSLEEKETRWNVIFYIELLGPISECTNKYGSYICGEIYKRAQSFAFRALRKSTITY
jgi:trehalose 6-phosphate synthase/phosphatase